MIFYLGTHRPTWLARVDIPLFVSRVTLAGRRRLPRALGMWALDSGGFTELDRHHGWAVTPSRYVEDVQRFADDIGNLEWAAPQDWMCEPWIIAKTGLSVTEHQRRTVANFLDLRSLAPDLPIVPVLQGWELDDYVRCIDLYDRAGVQLTAEPLVGLGSVCRRQATGQIGSIVTTLAHEGLSLHGFGVKMAGLRSYSLYLRSADSMAWSYRGRRSGPCVHGGRAKSEANCLPFARSWRERVLHAVARPQQLSLSLPTVHEGGTA